MTVRDSDIFPLLFRLAETFCQPARPLPAASAPNKDACFASNVSRSRKAVNHVPFGYDFGPVTKHFEKYFVDAVRGLSVRLGSAAYVGQWDSPDIELKRTVISEFTSIDR